MHRGDHRGLDPEIVALADAYRVLGHSYQWIGDVLGVTPARLRAAVVRARRKAKVLP